MLGSGCPPPAPPVPPAAAALVDGAGSVSLRVKAFSYMIKNPATVPKIWMARLTPQAFLTNERLQRKSFDSNLSERLSRWL